LENYPTAISNINEWKEASNLPDRPIGTTNVLDGEKIKVLGYNYGELPTPFKLTT
jgi:hypothetical protein